GIEFLSVTRAALGALRLVAGSYFLVAAFLARALLRIASIAVRLSLPALIVAGFILAVHAVFGFRLLVTSLLVGVRLLGIALSFFRIVASFPLRAFLLGRVVKVLARAVLGGCLVAAFFACIAW